MPIRCEPGEPNPTHDVSLIDRIGNKRGFIMCDANGNRSPSFHRVPVERTAFKTTTGNSQYSDMDYPYSPIVQENWSGGRGNLDFERDTTRFRDSFRMRTGRTNKAFLGPQEQFTSGLRSQDQLTPGNVVFQPLLDPQGIIAKRFQASASYTAGLAGVIVKCIGEPNDLRIRLSSDAAGARGSSLSSIDVPYTRLPDILSEWLAETVSEVLAATNYYWISIERTGTDTEENHWEIGTKPAVGSTYISPLTPSFNAATFDLYFRLAPADTENRAIAINYKELIYLIVSGNSGAPKIYENGERGAADSNAGQLNKLIDATKTWGTNALVGAVVRVIDGPGKEELQPWRLITANDGTSVTVDHDWQITHTTATTYVIVGLNTLHEITGHTLSSPVTDALVSTTGVLYCCMGDAVTAMRLRAFNDAGTWKHFDDATCHAGEAAGTKPVYIEYLPQQNKIVIANNSDASGAVSVSFMSNVTMPDWGTDLTWETAVPIGSKHRRITNLECYPDDQGSEALWVGKIDRPWIVGQTGNPYPMPLREMESVMTDENFQQSLMHNVYLYFPLGTGLEQYYAGQLTDLGPNLGEGLPANRRGPVSALAGYPGKFFAAIDAGAAGYSSVMMRDGNGWHEHYRAPLGQRISSLIFQSTPGTVLDRLWIYLGNDVIWLPFPSGDTNELSDPNMLYTHEGAIEMSRMHAGMFDVVKVARVIKAWADSLEEDVCWLEMDYRLDDDDTFTAFPLKFQLSPMSEHDLAGNANNPLFGLSGKEITLRLRFRTTDASKTPVLLAVILEAVMRISVKFLRPMTLLLEDSQVLLDGTIDDDQTGAFKKLDLMDTWASDKSQGMLLMRSRSELFDGRMVFLNPVDAHHIQVRDAKDDATRNRIVCVTSAQDA